MVKFMIKVIYKSKFLNVFSKIPRKKNTLIAQFPQNKIELCAENINHDAVHGTISSSKT